MDKTVAQDGTSIKLSITKERRNYKSLLMAFLRYSNSGQCQHERGHHGFSLMFCYGLWNTYTRGRLITLSGISFVHLYIYLCFFLLVSREPTSLHLFWRRANRSHCSRLSSHRDLSNWRTVKLIQNSTLMITQLPNWNYVALTHMHIFCKSYVGENLKYAFRICCKGTNITKRLRRTESLN